MSVFDVIRDTVNKNKPKTNSSSGSSGSKSIGSTIGGIIGSFTGIGSGLGSGIGAATEKIGGAISDATSGSYKDDILTPEQDYNDYIQQMAEAQRRSRIAALDKAKTNALSALDAEQAGLQPHYYDKRNQAAARSDVGAMNFAQYMAARGIKGAAGAMPEIYRNANLQGQIGALDRQEAQDIADIGRHRSDINTAYEYDVAQANADVDSTTMQALIDQWNADRQYRLQEAGLTGFLGGAVPTLARQQMETEYTGYYNPWAAYALNDDIQNQLAPYMGNLQAFIDANPNSPLVPYAQNARFQKIMSDPTLKAQYGGNYQTAAGMQSTLQNRLAQLEVEAQEIMNSNLPEVEKLKVEQLRQQVATGRLDPLIAQAQLAQIKAQTAKTLSSGSGSSGSGKTTEWQYKADLKQQANDIISSRIGAFRTAKDFDAELQRDVARGRLDPTLYATVKDILASTFEADTVLPTWKK